MITFYDLRAKDPIKTVSLNAWKIRYTLNYKNLDYKTAYYEFPDMRTEFEKLGIPPSSVTADGPSYTIPAIIDDSTNAKISESFNIALYLDKQYPNTPKVIPPGTEALQACFHEEFYKVLAVIYPIFFPKCRGGLNKPSADYFDSTREKMFGKSMADLEPKGEERVKAWKQVQEAFNTIDGWMSKSSGPYFMGETVSLADFTIGGLLTEFGLCLGAESQEWKDVMTWNNGRWAGLKKNLDKWANCDK
jgi:glutathione S-transferase